MTIAADKRSCPGCGADLTDFHVNRVWCSERCRKSQYAGTCKRCGGPTNGYNGKEAAASICGECLKPIPSEKREWILQKIYEWRERYGEPPTSLDWSPGMARTQGVLAAPEIKRRFESGNWPSTTTVSNYFGTFNRAVEEAGMSPLKVGTPRRHRAVSFDLPSACSACGCRHDSGDLDRCEINQQRKEAAHESGSHDGPTQAV